jgi:hypothetical protein
MEKKYYSLMFSDASYAGGREADAGGIIKTFW